MPTHHRGAVVSGACCEDIGHAGTEPAAQQMCGLIGLPARELSEVGVPRRPPAPVRGAVLSLVAAIAVVLPLVCVPPAEARSEVNPSSLESQVLLRVHEARKAHHLPGYRLGRRLSIIARDQARRMADRTTLFHNPQLASDVTNWTWVGENVGFGPDVHSVHVAFMRSAPHRANILDRDFTRIGVGVEVRGTRVWICQVFKTPRN
jgi:uncharacterized protein YkwD